MGHWSFPPPPPERSDNQIRDVGLRGHLMDKLKKLTQIGHGCFSFCPNREDPHTIQNSRPENNNSIHPDNVEVNGEPEILNLRDELKSGGIAHELGSDQPGNMSCNITILSPYFEKVSSD